MKHIIKCIAMICFALIMLPVYAQKVNDANLTGHVIDKISGEHIPFATVRIKASTIGAATDNTGHYMLSNLPLGKHVFVADFLGYQSLEQEFLIEEGKTKILDFSLFPKMEELDEVVVTGNRYATKKRETSTIVNVLSPKKFENTSSVNPAEVLNFQPGARVEYNCGNCGVPQLRINGLSGQYSQVLLDSRPVFSSLGMVYGLEQLPSSMIERVELVRGGGSALFGSNAIGGTLNIITKEPSTSMLELRNQSGLIGGKSLDANTSLNASLVSSDLRSGAYLFSMLRQRNPYDYNGDDFSEIPELKSQTVGFRAFQKIAKHSRLTLEYHHIHEYRRGGNLFDKPAHEADIAEQLDHNIDGGGLSYDFSAPNGKDFLSAYTSAQYIDRNSYFGTAQNLDAYGKTNDLTINSGAQWMHKFRKLWFMPSTLTAGFDYMYNNLEDRMLGYNKVSDQTVHLFGFYGQNEWSTERLGLLLGVRLDKHSFIDRPVVSPRLNIRYAINPNISLRASYARGYRAPQIYDEDLHVGAVGGDVALIMMGDDLKPEHSNTANFSFDYWLKKEDWRFNFLAEGFFTDLRDVFVLEERGRDEQGNILLERSNASGAMVAGINTELSLLYKELLTIQAGYTWQQSLYKEAFQWTTNSDITPQKTMFRAPNHYGYFTIDYKAIKGFTFSVNSVFTGSMLMQHYGPTFELDSETKTKVFSDIALRIAYDFKITRATNMQVFATVKNILNDFQPDLDYGADKDSKYIYGPSLPRSYFVGLKIGF